MSSQVSNVLWRLFLLATCIAFLSPVMGPLLDHHFAERQPDHVHIYFGERALDHEHPYSQAHFHWPDASFSKYTQTAESDGIVYLTSNELSGPSLVSLTSLPFTTDIIFPQTGDASLVFLLTDQETLPDEAFLDIPLRPPIA